MLSNIVIFTNSCQYNFQLGFLSPFNLIQWQNLCYPPRTPSAPPKLSHRRLSDSDPEHHQFSVSNLIDVNFLPETSCAESRGWDQQVEQASVVWLTTNREWNERALLVTGVNGLINRFNYWKFELGLMPDKSCDCGVDAQSIKRIVNECPVGRICEAISWC